MKDRAPTLTAIRPPPQSQILKSKVWKSRAEKLHLTICRIFYRPGTAIQFSDRRRHPEIASRSNRNAMPTRRKLGGGWRLCARIHRQRLWNRPRSRSPKRNGLRPLKKVSPRLSIYTGNQGGGFSE